MQINPAALKALRERSGMTVSALAAASGISQGTLSNIENGRRKAGPQTIVALAEALRVELPAILAMPDQVVPA